MEPRSRSLFLTQSEEQKEATFRLIPPKSVPPDPCYPVGFTAEVEGRRFHTQVQPIAYDHIGTSYLLTEAVSPSRPFR